MKRIVVGISGASGIPIAIEVLRAIKEQPEWQSSLVMTDGAVKTIELET